MEILVRFRFGLAEVDGRCERCAQHAKAVDKDKRTDAEVSQAIASFAGCVLGWRAIISGKEAAHSGKNSL